MGVSEDEEGEGEGAESARRPWRGVTRRGAPARMERGGWGEEDMGRRGNLGWEEDHPRGEEKHLLLPAVVYDSDLVSVPDILLPADIE
jgi:hypothetical protein